ncbi:hypothetical protein TRFO_18529 [Tritrichomonas foetus]|uniref:Uncharacterized protein n=1 Tax=Tritrichomonas foetus TaxID=1144522 RepID=A0A1J4KL29_9EUKA|nr:hypothetical protein TRFO_18529 [Tritrichomonas foetus]|eukprot:OHT11850.1 hypothetical protein TRFO_18529 [Tritrichomonas foetus]
MPPKGGLTASRPVAYSQQVGNKCSTIDELKREIEHIKAENEDIQKEIDVYENKSLSNIQHYREIIDSQTKTINAIRHKIDCVINEMKSKKKSMNDENTINKADIDKEKKEIEREIEVLNGKLDVIKKFEQEKESVVAEIKAKEAAIEEKKREFQESKSQTEKATKDLLERGKNANEDEIEKFKESYYEELLYNTDHAILLHIQRRNNYENDLLSLQDMFTEYTEKIQAREEANDKLRDTINGLKQNEIIKRSADQRKNIESLKKEVKMSKQQLTDVVEKSKVASVQCEKDRENEANKMELSLKYQQDKLDQKLHQISALRELTLTVLSFRTQLEAEFITVLGEKIFEVARETDRSIDSRATRKLSMTNSSIESKSTNTIIPKLKRHNQINIYHILAHFNMEDRIDVLTRFMGRIHNEMDRANPDDEEYLDEDTDIPLKPLSA